MAFPANSLFILAMVMVAGSLAGSAFAQSPALAPSPAAMTLMLVLAPSSTSKVTPPPAQSPKSEVVSRPVLPPFSISGSPAEAPAASPAPAPAANSAPVALPLFSVSAVFSVRCSRILLVLFLDGWLRRRPSMQAFVCDDFCYHKAFVICWFVGCLMLIVLRSFGIIALVLEFFWIFR